MIEFKAYIESNPSAGVDLGYGIRKVRFKVSAKGKGKSGGARVVSKNVIIGTYQTKIYLLTIYDKQKKDTITKAEIEQLLKQEGFI